MKIVSYSTKHYDSKHMDLINQDPRFQYDIEYFDFPLTQQTAKNAVGADAVCIFVNDDANRKYCRNWRISISESSHCAVRVLITWI